MSEPVARRIGDAERDQAAELLREHMAAGRLDHAEFDERLGQALSARTQPELDALFTDLPGERPGTGLAVPSAQPEIVPEEPQGPAEPRPWWTHWGLFAAAILLSAVTRGRAGPLIGLAAVWVFWLGPTIWSQQQAGRRAAEQRRRRELGH
ncbi:DUF1707 domain-containing protein [Luteococcus peritonei]|uniref:DUF1707 domain-containing protein n=1 Tax=Luteococcus peritonei TaxID=88874 RepID=A0ABW4RY31_9ACTN